MSYEIIPAILAKSAKEFKRKLNVIEDRVPLVQVDVMDGRYVPNKTWFKAETVATWNPKVEFELHLMVKNPYPVIADWMKVRGLRRVIVHAESPVNLKDAIRFARDKCLEIGVAISPGTSLRKLLPLVKRFDMALVMGGKPGFSGQSLDPKTLVTVRALRRHFPKLPIGFDIGVSAKTIPVLKRAGVTRFCAASAIFNSKNPGRALVKLTRIAQT